MNKTFFPRAYRHLRKIALMVIDIARDNRACSPFEQRWTTRAYATHYRFALAHTDIHIHLEIPATGYVPGAAAIDRMIAVGERAAYRSFESLSRAQAA